MIVIFMGSAAVLLVIFGLTKIVGQPGHDSIPIGALMAVAFPVVMCLADLTMMPGLTPTRCFQICYFAQVVVSVLVAADMFYSGFSRIQGHGCGQGISHSMCMDRAAMQ